jgi:LacI family transcriptional regulator
MKRVSINTIARETGVSRNTVSLALRDDPRVAVDTKERVLEAARRLDYRPNLLAKAVVTGRSQMLGLALPRLDFSYMPRFVEAVQEVAFAHGYGVLSCYHHNDHGRLADAVSYLLDRRVDGVVVYCPVPEAPMATWSELKPVAASCVFLSFGREQKLPGLSLELLPESAGAMAVHRLAELGHRQIGFAGAGDGFFEQARLAGVRQAAAESGVELVGVYAGEHSLEGGRVAAKQFLEALQRPTAVIGFADPVAVGFLQAVSQAGVRIPDDLSVIGVDDLPIAAATTPPLTTLRAPAEALGETATKALIEGTLAKPQRRTFDWQLIERESIRAINVNEKRP